MFTKATQHCGVWKEERPSSLISKSMLFFQIFMGLVAMAVVVLLLYVISNKIKQDFFFIKHINIPFQKMSADYNHLVFEERAASIEVLVFKNKYNNYDLVFQDKSMFSLPKEEEKLKRYLKARQNSIIFTALLERQNSAEISRVKIFSQEGFQLADAHRISGLFTDYGFFDFDFALEVKK